MKHLLNNLSDTEKNSILEQHTDRINVRTDRFKTLLESSLGDAKPLSMDIEGGEEHSTRYMFFSNLEQLKRQCEILLEIDEETITEILENGHDWAQDHISEAKNNVDQVFDFLMNETKGDDEY
jgi:hypothetical protein